MQLKEICVGLFGELFFGFFFFNLNRAGNVKTLLHARDVELDHSQVFAFDYDASQRPHKSEREVEEGEVEEKPSRQNEMSWERHKDNVGTV